MASPDTKPCHTRHLFLPTDTGQPVRDKVSAAALLTGSTNQVSAGSVSEAHSTLPLDSGSGLAASFSNGRHRGTEQPPPPCKRTLFRMHRGALTALNQRNMLQVGSGSSTTMDAMARAWFMPPVMYLGNLRGSRFLVSLVASSLSASQFTTPDPLPAANIPTGSASQASIQSIPCIQPSQFRAQTSLIHLSATHNKYKQLCMDGFRCIMCILYALGTKQHPGRQ